MQQHQTEDRNQRRSGSARRDEGAEESSERGRNFQEKAYPDVGVAVPDECRGGADDVAITETRLAPMA